MSTIKPSVAEKFAAHVPFHRPLAEIERAAAVMGSSPMDDGVVEMIVCRPSIDERRVLDEGVLDVTHRLLGDSWETRGASTPGRGPDPLRQITVTPSPVVGPGHDRA